VRASWSNVVVTLTGEGARSVVFADDQVEAALARFEELRPGQALENLASRNCLQGYALLAEGDLEAVTRLLADDAVIDDRRRGLALAIDGQQSLVDYLSATAGIGLGQWQNCVLATRGDRVALITASVDVGPNRFGTDVLHVVEVDGTGRMTALVMFQPEEQDAAYAELDARYLAGEAAPYAEAWREIVDGIDAVNRRDLSSLDEHSVIDHSPQWMPTGTVSASIGLLVELVPDLVVRTIEVHRLDDHGAVMTVTCEGTSAEGLPVSWASVVVGTAGEGALTELFGEDQLDAALARFEELGAS
jgi:hypothetical protein